MKLVRTKSEFCFEKNSFVFFIVVLQSLQTEYERVMSLKKDLEKQLDERANELKTTKTVANSFTNQLKEKLEQITDAKVTNGLICSSEKYHMTGNFILRQNDFH
jgi:hypothetical protein